MKLYILRHFQRDINNASFKSELIKEGINQAINKSFILKNLDINMIFSSPFIRCIQSVDYYSKINNIDINIDYSLSEFFHINEKKIYINDDYNIPEDWFRKFNIKNEYSILNKYNINETSNDVIERVHTFIKEIINKYKNTDKNIILVTHMTIVNIILYYFNKIHYGDNISINFEAKYDMGRLLLLYRSK